MRVLIVGCGFVGERTADLLHAAGHEVVGVTHSPSSAERLAALKPWRVVACDVSDAQAVKTLRDVTVPDAFIHCASSGKGGAEMYQAVYVNGMANLLAAFPQAFPLYTGSTSVYPQTDGSEVDESSPADPGKETGRLLLAAEKLALDHGGAVARLAGIYGPGRSFVLKNLLEGKSGIEVNASAPDGRLLNQIHADDAAAALVHLITHRHTGIYNVVDDARMTQRACLERLALLFNLPVPEEKAPDPDRKRGWTHKQVSNAKLRATGWAPQYPDYFDALRDDPQLSASILQLVLDGGEVRLPRAENIVLIGLMGSGKSTVGRMVAHMLGFQFADTDHLIIEKAGCSIPEIFAKEGEDGFRLRESEALRSLLGCRHCVIATGGGIITQVRNRPLLQHLGFITWLEADPKLLARRTASNNDRPLLRGEEPPLVKLERLLSERKPLYKQLADLRIQTDELSQQESAYGVAESARIFFAQRRAC
ncbi:shikimate kinase [Prosthecobacter fusiformis]|uniref:Shikimate kinase n=1 Tax=Prosthecobacter fusiformis TaxID=48464 RepID=A0A4R7RYX1_9BACT|nr:shikimate kinase [Prosthecobacter fusiformis]TDU71102.1 shikimate kinase [Prosthecobacter fusiformis]